MLNQNKLYKIVWKHPIRNGTYIILKICDYLIVSFPFLYRDQVVSTNIDKLKKTVDYLNLISCKDEEFFIIEKEIYA